MNSERKAGETSDPPCIRIAPSSRANSAARMRRHRSARTGTVKITTKRPKRTKNFFENLRGLRELRGEASGPAPQSVQNLEPSTHAPAVLVVRRAEFSAQVTFFADD